MGEVGVGRKRRRNVAAEEENPRPCCQYKAPRADSLHRDEEDGEAHLPVVSSQQGKVYSGDAMMRRRVPVLFVGFVGSQRIRKLREMEG
jgi:hypothetical protein